MRAVFAALAGGVFGAGLLISGMVDTLKVQGFLDVSGAWDPTLAFVMGGAFPPTPTQNLGTDLIAGSVMFGMGWALVGLCPGPALASLAFGGWGGVVFLCAMSAGMLATPIARKAFGFRTPL